MVRATTTAGQGIFTTLPTHLFYRFACREAFDLFSDQCLCRYFGTGFFMQKEKYITLIDAGNTTLLFTLASLTKIKNVNLIASNSIPYLNLKFEA